MLAVKITLLYVGKPRDPSANQLAGEYARRIARFCDFRMQQVRGEESLARRERAYRVVLDPGGRQLSSREFAAVIERAENAAVRELVFFVGGAEGVSESTRRQADLLLALSGLTLPHELARVILSEQIYRAFTMLRHHPYAR